jgi:hypothetical protein
MNARRSIAIPRVARGATPDAESRPSPAVSMVQDVTALAKIVQRDWIISSAEDRS